MLSRDQVLHVARLARLELDEEELERMAGELSGVLDHIEKIGELGDLDGGPTTSTRSRGCPARSHRRTSIATRRSGASPSQSRTSSAPRASPARRARRS